MIRLIVRRLLWTVPLVWLIATLVFFLMRLAPGGPFDGDVKRSDAVIAKLEQQYGLSDPSWLRQYGRYMAGLVQGRLGPSLCYRGRDVAEIIADALPVSAALGCLGLSLAVVIGVALGLVGAMRHGRLADRAIQWATAVLVSLPGFLLGAGLLIVLAFSWRLLPAGGWGRPEHMVMPALTLALPTAAVIARILRASLLEELSQDYMRTARAKGLSPVQAALRHSLTPAMVPLLGYLGPAAAAILTGSIVVERIFLVPGIGQHFVNGALNRDYTLVLGLVLVYSTLLLVFNLMVDVLHAWFDPRVREP